MECYHSLGYLATLFKICHVHICWQQPTSCFYGHFFVNAMKRSQNNSKIATTSENYEDFISQPVVSSLNREWKHVIVRYYREPDEVDLRIVPSLADLHIVVVLSASLVVEQKSDDVWIKTPVNTGDVFIVPPHMPTYKMRWKRLLTDRSMSK